MAVFVAPVLDDFNRGTASPPSANWTRYSSTSDDLGIHATVELNRCSVQGTSSNLSNYADVWNPSTYYNCEAYFDVMTWSVVTNNQVALFARVQNPGAASTTATGYGCVFFPPGSALAGTCTIFTYILQSSLGNGSAYTFGTQLSAATFQITAGDRLGFRVYDYTGPGLPGVMLEAWQRPASTGRWQRVHAANDHTSAIKSPGNIGAYWSVGATGQRISFDNFGGGGISVPSPTTINTTDWDSVVTVLYGGATRDRIAEKGGVKQGSNPPFRDWLWPAVARRDRIAELAMQRSDERPHGDTASPVKSGGGIVIL
jgi:hypothetical protein